MDASFTNLHRENQALLHEVLNIVNYKMACKSYIAVFSANIMGLNLNFYEKFRISGGFVKKFIMIIVFINFLHL